MKLAYYYALSVLCLSLLLMDCKKDTAVMEPELEVNVSSATCKAGDSVVFYIEGDPDIITLYSGVRGSDYSFKDKERIYPSSTSLSFQSAKYAGNNADCASLKYSTDFNGVYEPSSIREASWIDITDRFHIPSINGSSAVMEDAGEADISDIFPNNTDPVYFAWFFTTQAKSNRTRFQIRDFLVNGVVADNPDLSGTKYDFVSCGFNMVQGEGFLEEGSDTYYPRVTASAIIWDGIYAAQVFKEGWAVSVPIYPAAEISLGRDIGTGIKSVLDPPLKSYTVKYETPGTYTATFVASNASVYGQKKITRQIKITVTP